MDAINLPNRLLTDLKSIFAECDQFKSYDDLKAFCIGDELAFIKKRIRNADNTINLVAFFIEDFYEKVWDSQRAIFVFIKCLLGDLDEKDARHADLKQWLRKAEQYIFLNTEKSCLLSELKDVNIQQLRHYYGQVLPSSEQDRQMMQLDDMLDSFFPRNQVELSDEKVLHFLEFIEIIAYYEKQKASILNNRSNSEFVQLFNVENKIIYQIREKVAQERKIKPAIQTIPTSHSDKSDKQDEPNQNPLKALADLRSFLASSSPKANDFIKSLSALPLSVPIICAVKEALLPEPNNEALVEVSLSGLIQRHQHPSTPVPTIYANQVWYDFLPGIREELNLALGPQKLADILRKTEDKIADALGIKLNICELIKDFDSKKPFKFDIDNLFYVNELISILYRVGGDDCIAIAKRIERAIYLLDELNDRSGKSIFNSDRSIKIFQIQLFQVLDACFDLNGLEHLCFDLEIEYDDLVGQDKLAKILALYKHVSDQNKIVLLCEIIKKHDGYDLMNEIPSSIKNISNNRQISSYRTELINFIDRVINAFKRTTGKNEADLKYIFESYKHEFESIIDKINKIQFFQANRRYCIFKLTQRLYKTGGMKNLLERLSNLRPDENWGTPIARPSYNQITEAMSVFFNKEDLRDLDLSLGLGVSDVYRLEKKTELQNCIINFATQNNDEGENYRKNLLKWCKENRPFIDWNDLEFPNKSNTLPKPVGNELEVAASQAFSWQDMFALCFDLGIDYFGLLPSNQPIAKIEVFRKIFSLFKEQQKEGVLERYLSIMRPGIFSLTGLQNTEDTKNEFSTGNSYYDARRELKGRLKKIFNLEDIRRIIGHINLNNEWLVIKSEDIQETIIKIINFFEKRKNISLLVSQCRKERPDIYWEDLVFERN